MNVLLHHIRKQKVILRCVVVDGSSLLHLFICCAVSVFEMADEDTQNTSQTKEGGTIQTEEDDKRYCWVCFATDEDDTAAAWVQTCSCRGTTKWAC